MKTEIAGIESLNSNYLDRSPLKSFCKCPKWIDQIFSELWDTILISNKSNALDSTSKVSFCLSLGSRWEIFKHKTWEASSVWKTYCCCSFLPVVHSRYAFDFSCLAKVLLCNCLLPSKGGFRETVLLWLKAL